MITQIIYHGYPDGKLSKPIWDLLPQLLFVCTGKDDQDEGFGYENLNVVTLGIKNYISRDPDGMIEIPNNETRNMLELTVHFL